MARKKSGRPVISLCLLLSALSVLIPGRSTFRHAGVWAPLLTVLLASGQVYALTSRDIIRLKKSAVPENLITLMLETGYENADEVISLEKAGIGAAAIQAFVLANGRENKKGNIVYSTKGLEDQPPCGGENTFAPYWRDMLPDTKLFIVPNGKWTQGQGNTGRGGRGQGTSGVK